MSPRESPATHSAVDAHVTYSGLPVPVWLPTSNAAGAEKTKGGAAVADVADADESTPSATTTPRSAVAKRRAPGMVGFTNTPYSDLTEIGNDLALSGCSSLLTEECHPA